MVSVGPVMAICVTYSAPQRYFELNSIIRKSDFFRRYKSTADRPI